MRYIITGYDEKERRRLTALASLLDPFTFQELDRIGLQPDWHCIEIGAGLGTVSQWMAERLHRGGDVLCSDLQTDFIDEIDHPRIRTERLDISKSPDYFDQFDLAVLRAVHHHIADRDAAARSLVRMVRPGGHLLLIEPDIHPPLCDDHPAWKRLWQALFQWGGRRDIDYFTGRRVPGQLAALGLDVVSVRGETALFNGSGPDDPARETYRKMFDVVLPDLVGGGFLSRADQEDAYALLDNPRVWLMGFCFVATHARKPDPPRELP